MVVLRVCPSTSCSKTPFNLTLSGITNDDVDLSVDALKAVTLPLLKQFGVAEEGGLELKVCCALPVRPIFAQYGVCVVCEGRGAV